MKKILSILMLLLLCNSAYAFTVFFLPYDAKGCKGKVGALVYDYQLYPTYPKHLFTGSVYLDEIESNRQIVKGLFKTMSCNSSPEGRMEVYSEFGCYDMMEIPIPDPPVPCPVPEGWTLIIKDGVKYLQQDWDLNCPHFCADANGQLIYRGPFSHIYQEFFQ